MKIVIGSCISITLLKFRTKRIKIDVTEPETSFLNLLPYDPETTLPTMQLFLQRFRCLMLVAANVTLSCRSGKLTSFQLYTTRFDSSEVMWGSLSCSFLPNHSDFLESLLGQQVSRKSLFLSKPSLNYILSWLLFSFCAVVFLYTVSMLS